MDTLEVVLMDIRNERERQDEKWGDQSGSLDGTGPTATPLLRMVGMSFYSLAPELAALATRQTDQQSAEPWGASMASILLEEVFEAIAEDDPIKLRMELVQVAAVAAAWCEYLDRRGANPRPVI